MQLSLSCSPQIQHAASQDQDLNDDPPTTFRRNWVRKRTDNPLRSQRGTSWRCHTWRSMLRRHPNHPANICPRSAREKAVPGPDQHHGRRILAFFSARRGRARAHREAGAGWQEGCQDARCTGRPMHRGVAAKRAPVPTAFSGIIVGVTNRDKTRPQPVPMGASIFVQSVKQFRKRTGDYWAIADQSMRLMETVIAAAKTLWMKINCEIVPVSVISDDVPRGCYIIRIFLPDDDWIGRNNSIW